MGCHKFGIEQNVRERERERERERREKNKASFSGDFTRFCLTELSSPRVKVALRDESYAWVPESQDFAKF